MQRFRGGLVCKARRRWLTPSPLRPDGLATLGRSAARPRYARPRPPVARPRCARPSSGRPPEGVDHAARRPPEGVDGEAGGRGGPKGPWPRGSTLLTARGRRQSLLAMGGRCVEDSCPVKRRVVQVYLTQCIYQLGSESHPPHKTVNLIF